MTDRRGGLRSPGPGALLVAMLLFGAWPCSAEDAPAPTDLTELSLEELMKTDVTSVSKKPEPRSAAADAIYVITSEDISRSGARTLADALRLAPGMQVARIDSNKWAVGVRGFASRLARSVLVLIDGRSVYTPLFAGTYWETQEVLIEDIDRIEIIRGPGGTLWGANAFNGVINVITRNARETQGGYLIAGGGTEERGFGGLRYGGRVGDQGYYRAYARGFGRDAGFNAAGPEYDDWRMGQSGFRTDWDLGPRDALTFQGDVYQGTSGQRAVTSHYRPPFTRVALEETDFSGANVIGRWTRVLSDRSDLALQLFYDNTYRQEPTFRETRNTADGDFQHRFRLSPRQELTWGLGYRLTADRTEGLPTLVFDPADRTDNLVSAFAQDEVVLVPERLRFTFGTKLEHNDYTGVEVQPSARLLFTPPDSRHTVWASVARAVRTPSRVEHDLAATLATPGAPGAFLRLQGDEDFVSEKVLDYQLGYRVRPHSRVFLDVVGFYNQFKDLLSAERRRRFTEARPAPPHLIIPYALDNGLHGDTYGAEVAADAAVTRWWRLAATYSYLVIDLDRDDGSLDPGSDAGLEDSSPHHQAMLRSMMNLGRYQLDGVLRYVDALPGQRVGSYVEADVRVARRIRDTLELSVVGQNLVEAHHREFAGGTEVQRGVYGQVRWWW